MPNRFPLCIVVCLIFFSIDSMPAASKTDVSAWNMIDLTETIELAGMDEDHSMVTISFKNRSTEVVTAVALSFRADAHYYQDWLNAEPSGLAPGQTFSLTISAEDGANRRIKISAVIYEDGSGKGEQAQLDLMHCHRFGQILENARIKDILRNRRSNDDSGMNALLQKVGKLPLSAEDAFMSLAGISVPGIPMASLKQQDEKARDAVLWGVSTTRERAQHQFEAVKQLPVLSADEATANRAAVLSVLQEQYETQNQKALALLARMQGGR